jgi:hypothetical protein
MTANSNKAPPLPREKVDAAAIALFGAMFLGLAVAGAAALWTPVANALQDLAPQVWGGGAARSEGEQRRQADTLAELGRIVNTVSADQRTITARMDQTADQAALASDRIALLESDLSALTAELQALHKVRGEAVAAVPWGEVVGQLGAAAARARTDIGGLRSSLDELAQTHQQDIAAMARRLDGLEQHQADRAGGIGSGESARIDALRMRLDALEQRIAGDLTAAIRPPARKKQARKRPRPSAVVTRAAQNSVSRSGVTGAPILFAPPGVQVRRNAARTVCCDSGRLRSDDIHVLARGAPLAKSQAFPANVTRV